jgi:raffinose/stachyose/melibiose transport system permease protein
MSKALRFHLSIWWHYAIALIFAGIFGFPLVWMIYSSLKPTRELVNNIWALPTHPTLNAYGQVLGIPEFKFYFLNSILMTVASVALLTIVAAMAAYVLARIQIPGRNVVFYTFLAGMMIPVHVTLIPLYAMQRDLGLLNTLPSLLFPYVGFGLPVSIYILRGFFEQIPVELDEAARMDGASTVRIFWSIVLPLSRPALITVIILSVVSAWNEYLFALTFVSGNNTAYTLPLGVLSMVRSFGGFQYDKALSALTLAALPVLVFYFLMQRQIIKSLVAGALKG